MCASCRGFPLERLDISVQSGPRKSQYHRAASHFMAERRRVRTFEWSTAIIASISVIAGTIVYVRDGFDRFLTILFADSWLFAGMLPKMLAGCLIAAFVTRLLPREVVARVVGAESGV